MGEDKCQHLAGEKEKKGAINRNFTHSYTETHPQQKGRMSVNPIEISDYEQLSEIAARFSEGRLDRLLIVGSPGLFKTETIRKSMTGKFLYLRGRSSPVSLYGELFRGKGRPVVIDDCEVMLGDKNAQEILRDLLETSDVKEIAWRTQSHLLKEKKLPTSFKTTSACCIIANGIGKGRVWGAILSRVVICHFSPTWEQVLSYMEPWFEDKEILNFARARQSELGRPDGRRLLNAAAIKQASLGSVDWQDLLQSEITSSCNESDEDSQGISLVKELCADGSLYAKDRVKAFCEKSSLSRATFFRYQKKLTKEGFIPARVAQSAESRVESDQQVSLQEAVVEPVLSASVNEFEGERDRKKSEKIKIILKKRENLVAAGA